MTRKTTKTKTRKSYPKKDHYQVVTDQIVAALEAGTTPWVCPWDRVAGLPHNGHSGHVYRGINTWLTWASGHNDPRWFTFKQVGNYGTSHVRKGEKSTPIIFWSFVKKTDEDDDGTTRTRTIPMLRTFAVFNYTQIEWDAEHMPKGVELRDIDPATACAEAAAFVTETGAEVVHGGNRACYSPSMDRISMPEAGAFKDAQNYWSTLLHEVTHWSGHTSRCNRDLKGRFGSEAYAAEELVAELGSAFLCADFGIKGGLQHPEYVANWLKVLKGDKYAVFTAARLAKQAVTFLKGEESAEESADETEVAESKAA